MERRTEFPALEARKEFLEHSAYEAQKQATDALSAGRPDNAIMQWLAGIKAELDELRYVLKMLGSNENRINVTGRTFTIVILILVIVMLLQILVLFYAGH